ncbi:hypothetical protein [Mycobacterium leprae]|uniref:hypothetical protein n=2 Tax=Mycobacterium leprae TaxID=1769 RepID=UPI0002DD8A9B
MTEMIVVLWAIFDAWHSGGSLNFCGDYYRNTLMTSAFHPVPKTVPGRRRARRWSVGDVVRLEAFLHHVMVPAVRDGLLESGLLGRYFAVILEIFCRLVTLIGDEMM